MEQHPGQTLLLLLRKKSTLLFKSPHFILKDPAEGERSDLYNLLQLAQQLMGPLSWPSADSRRPRFHAGGAQDAFPKGSGCRARCAEHGSRRSGLCQGQVSCPSRAIPVTAETPAPQPLSRRSDERPGSSRTVRAERRPRRALPAGPGRRPRSPPRRRQRELRARVWSQAAGPDGAGRAAPREGRGPLGPQRGAGPVRQPQPPAGERPDPCSPAAAAPGLPHLPGCLYISAAREPSACASPVPLLSEAVHISVPRDGGQHPRRCLRSPEGRGARVPTFPRIGSPELAWALPRTESGQPLEHATLGARREHGGRPEPRGEGSGVSGGTRAAAPALPCAAPGPHLSA